MGCEGETQFVCLSAYKVKEAIVYSPNPSCHLPVFHEQCVSNKPCNEIPSTQSVDRDFSSVWKKGQEFAMMQVSAIPQLIILSSSM
mmetsp:Transcript_50972/g.76228  ORF Transcript_50972/g.76228 Transcript_50972/m.76228 type:complete len:86 (+) Transcript_50972:899-1156(+)